MRWRVYCPTRDRKNTFLGDHRFQRFVFALAISLVIISPSITYFRKKGSAGLFVFPDAAFL